MARLLVVESADWNRTFGLSRDSESGIDKYRIDKE